MHPRHLATSIRSSRLKRIIVMRIVVVRSKRGRDKGSIPVLLRTYEKRNSKNMSMLVFRTKYFKLSMSIWLRFTLVVL